MNTHAPRPRQLVALGMFVLACFGLTLYMWITFGGSSPLKPTGYHLYVPMPDAGEITNQSDVRIAGVDVGKVIGKTTDARGRLTRVELDIDPRYAPRPRDTRAILRQKTLLGETYLELSPGSPRAGEVHDGGSLRVAAVGTAVHIDDLLRTFDPGTRRAFATWMTEQGAAFRHGGGQALNAALAQLPALGRFGGSALALFRRQDAALQGFLRDGGTSLGALTARRGQLRALVRNADRVFATTARSDQALADTFHVFPTFLRESRLTLGQFGDFAESATPLVRQLRPAARATAPLLADTRRLAPPLRRLLSAIGPLASASRSGLPALRDVLDPTVGVLRHATPWLGTLVPVVDYLTRYKRELAGVFANVAAATQATLPAADGSGPLHYLRGALPINPESLAAFPGRLPSSRANAYPGPGAYGHLRSGLETYSPCTAGAEPTLSDSIPDDRRRDVADNYFTDNPNGPPCRTQPPLGPTTGAGGGTFPKLTALP